VDASIPGASSLAQSGESPHAPDQPKPSVTDQRLRGHGLSDLADVRRPLCVSGDVHLVPKS